MKKRTISILIAVLMVSVVFLTSCETNGDAKKISKEEKATFLSRFIDLFSSKLKSCEELSGFICVEGETCQGNWLKASDTKSCCSQPCGASKCGDGICDEKEQSNPNLCPKDCTEPDEGYEVEDISYQIEGPNGYELRVRTVRPKISLYPNEKFPAILKIAGGWGGMTGLLNDNYVPEAASKGIIFVAFDSPMRLDYPVGSSERDYKGFKDQKDYAFILQNIINDPNVDKVGIWTWSSGAILASSVLGRYPELDVAFFIDGEGPHCARDLLDDPILDVDTIRGLQNWILARDALVGPGKQYENEDDFWYERCGNNFLGNYKGIYHRLQGRKDHALGYYYKHAVSYLNAATSGEAKWTRLNKEGKDQFYSSGVEANGVLIADVLDVEVFSGADDERAWNTFYKILEESETQSESKIQPYFIAIHTEPAGMYPENYDVLKNHVKRADEYNIKLTLMFSSTWADYIAKSPERMVEVKTWQKEGHEIAGHHHSIYHGGWDGYTDFTEEEAISQRISQGVEPEPYLGTLDDLMTKLKQVNPNMNSGCMNDEETFKSLPDEIIYDTCSGYYNFGEPQREALAADPELARNKYVSVGIVDGTQRKWLTHGQITTADKQQHVKKIFETTSSGALGAVTHATKRNGQDQLLLDFLDFVHEKDPTGSKSMTQKGIIESGILSEKRIAVE